MKIAKIIAAFALLFAAASAHAQNGTMTPYSSFGYGILSDHATSSQRAMGGVGYAMNSGRQINAMNPASYAAIDTLTFLFDMGVDVTALWQTETIDGTIRKDNHFGGGLDYATMQFPLGRYMGASVGIIPFSSVGYSFGSEIENGIDSRQGSGGLSELYVGVAGRPFKGFSIGANISYLFGTIINDTYATASSGNYSTLYQKQLEVRDYHLNFGAQYSFPIRSADRITLGLTYSPQKTLLGNARMIYYDTQAGTEPKETDGHKLKDNYSLPDTWGAGICYHLDRRLMVEFDYTYQPWSKAKFRGFDGENIDNRYADRSKYALGMQFTPNIRGSYFKRIQYRAGLYYNNDYLMVRNNRLREYGVTCGFGFPVPAFKTIVNLGFEWKHRQAHPNPLIKENYFNITLGINFNEMWFAQSKID